MATFTNLENAHVFSKAVITPSMSAAAAGNTSAHTIQSKDTWAEAVPFLEKSDLSGVSTDKVFKLDGYGTVKFHYKKNVYCLINSNNNDIPSNGYVGKIIDSEGNTINQFISPTDVVNSTGQMATVYQPSLYDSKGESMPLSEYIINPSNGLIYDIKSTGNQGIFLPSATDGKTEYKLSFFTYEGAKLDTTITNIKGSIDQNSDRIDNVEDAYKKADTAINASISTINTSISNLSGRIDNVEDAYKKADTAINASISTINTSISTLSSDISSHTNDTEIHVSEEDRALWNKGGNMDITGDNFITPEKTNTGWSLSLNNSTVVGASIASNVDGNKKVPTVNAVTTRVNDAITLHERNKNHLGFDQISFALSGGHLANKISNELKESSKYSFEYVENISASGINHAGLIVNNKSPKGLNAIFRKLTIKKVQPINVSKLYAHIYKTSQRDITSGLLENGEYILTLEADITTPGEITLNFGNELIISKEYYYGIKFTESETVTSAEFVLNYDNFANVNYDPSSSDPSYPSLITNKVVTDTVIEDITYNIPCVMEFEDYEIPTSNAVKTYVDNLIDGYAEESSDIIWNLNDLLVSCINDTDKSGAKWVQELLRLSATVNNGFISIADYEAIYNTSNLVEATEKWIAEASDPNRSLSTQLVFKQDSYVTNQLFRLFFYNLDHKLQKTYGADDSISRKFMKRGLTFRYLTKLESEMALERPNEGFGKPRYKYIILRYRGEVANPPAGKVEIDWNHIPNINNTVNSTSTADIFQMAKAWDIIDNEDYNNSNIIKTNIEDLDERIAIIEGVTPFNTLETQPSETTQWIAAEFKETENINNIINKKIRGISIKVANTVSSPQYLAVFDTRTSGTKKLLGVSKGTTWNANETAEFKFSSSIIIPGSFEIFLLDNPISTDLSGDPNKPSYYIESYSLSGNQSYRNINGSWNNSKRSFYLTFNFVGDRMTAAEENIEEHLEDNERHITIDERNKWNETYNLKYSIKTLVPNEYSVNGTAHSGGFTTFVLPNDFYPANIQFNSVKIDTLNINGTTPTEAYLGVMALYSDGTKKALSISDNTNLSGTKGSPVWYFSTPFTIEEDYRLIFYILKDKESFIEPEPTVDPNVAIGAVIYNTNVLDPYYNWQAAQTDLNFGFIVNGPYQQNKSYAGWPACTLYKLNHVNNQDIHISSEERERWNKGGNIQITGDDFINPELVESGWDISLNTATTIDTSNNTNDAKTVPTVEAVKTYVDNLIDGYAEESSDIIWNLNDLLVSCVNDTDKNGAKWVQELLRTNANNNSTLISIINYESIYNTTNIVEATEKWIAEACAEGSNLSTQLAFRQDSFMTNQLFRLFFYNLDHKFGKIYGADDSISRKFMKRGLTFKYLTKVEGDPVLNYPNEGFGKPRYKYITLRYRGKTIDGTDKPLEIDWDHIPTIANTVNSSTTADTFQMAKAWDIIDSEEYDNNVYINGDDFINVDENGNTWGLSLNVVSDISDNNQNLNEIKNSTVPTVNAVKTYVDNTVDEHKKDTIGTELSTWDIETAFTDGATNVFDFTCNSPFTGILTEVRLYCSGNAAGGESYLEIRQNDKILARSTNAQYHSTNNLLKFNFNNILLKLGDRYGFYIVDKNGSKPGTSCLALSTKNSVPEVANLNVVVSNYSNHTPRFGFTYYKSNREIINNTLNKLNSDLVYDISYKYSNLNNITNVTNRTITFADNSKIDFPINKITHGKYAFRTKSNTTSPLTEFNLRIIDGGKPGANYDSAYYYERDVRNNSYDEDVGGNLETLGNLINGDGMFIRAGITIFNDDLSCLIRARQMFTNSSLTTFRSALPSLTFADRMFLGTKLTEFKIKLPNLSSAECMFRLCKNLEFVDTCLPNLTFAQGMFGYCTALKRIDLSPSSGANLYLADNMFTGCENLTSVKLNLEYLENAKDMFASGVYSNITYNAPLLDLSSVINIANTIKDWTNDYYTNKVHEIAIGINETSEIYNSGSSSYKQYIDQIADKNWKVSLYTSNSRQSPAFTIVKD